VREDLAVALLLPLYKAEFRGGEDGPRAVCGVRQLSVLIQG